jgi:hypothetical protein
MNISLIRFLAIGALASVSAFGSLLTIQNPSFELTPSGSNFGSVGSGTVGVIANFTLSDTNAQGTFKPNTGAGGVFTQAIPDGVQTAFNNGGLITQTLGSTYVANTTYTFAGFVGQRLDVPLPSFGLDLYAGNVLLTPGFSSVAPGAGKFAAVSITFNTSSNPSVIGQPITIGLAAVANGGQVNFDALTLNATSNGPTAAPEPATLVIMGSGLLGIALLRRRSQARKQI